VISFSDEWFAEAANLIKPNPPIRQIGKFVPTGAWFDGWETRRHNTEPADWVIIKLGVSSAKLVGCEVDTAFFNGNEAPAIAVEAAFVSDETTLGKAQWTTVISKQPCGPSQRHFFLRSEITQESYTHIRLKMFPDGGIARFRMYGTPVPVFPEDLNTVFDLAHVSSGGVAIARSDQHFGSADNILLPGRGKDMGDGWETARSRSEGHTDWVIVKLGAQGYIDKIVVDTIHFLGNYPQSIEVHGLLLDAETVGPNDPRWKLIVGPTKMQPNIEHFYEGGSLSGKGQIFSHVKLTIIPDGGVKRLRVFGRRAV
jgi:allantoicase